MFKIASISFLFVIVFFLSNNIQGFQFDSPNDCGTICNEVCHTFYMEDCTYTWCQFDESEPGQTWMCLGEARFPGPGGQD